MSERETPGGHRAQQERRRGRSTSARGKTQRLRVVATTDPRVREALEDIKAACRAYDLDLIDGAERRRLIARAAAKLAELGLEVAEDTEPPRQPARPKYRRQRVRYADDLNREHPASFIAHWLEVSLIDEDEAGFIRMSAEKARGLEWAARSISYSIDVDAAKRRGERR
jgi:hypothetical protein